MNDDINDILSFPYIEVREKNDDCRIYYDKNIYPSSDEKWGFYFWVIEVLSCSCREEPFSPDSEFQILFHGSARYDGFSEIYLGNKDFNEREGIEDPNVGLLAKVLEELKKMEKQYCANSFYD